MSDLAGWGLRKSWLGIGAGLLLLFPSLCWSIPNKPQGLVSDYAGIFSAASPVRGQLEALLLDLRKKTSAEIVVVTVKNLEGQSIDGYAVELFEKWGIGQKGKDNGILLLVSVEDKKYRIEIGYGLEGLIPDGRAGEIGRQLLVPRFKAGDFEGGIASAALNLASIVAEDAGVQLSMAAPQSSRTGRRRSRSPFGIIFVIIMMMIFGRGRGRGGLWLLPMLLLSGGRGGYWSSGSGGFGSGMGGGGFSGGFGGGFSGGGGASGGW